MAQPIRLDLMRHRQLDISHGCQNHTVLPYASAPYVLRDVNRSRVAPPHGHLPRRRCRVHHIPPRVRDDRDTPLLSRRDSAEKATDLGRRGSCLFLRARLDVANHVELATENRALAHRPSIPVSHRGHLPRLVWRYSGREPGVPALHGSA